MKWRLFRLDWKYAFGELIIVTLGVGIALYADQWASQQSIKRTEIEYIERLIADLQEDQNRLDIAQGFLSRKNPSLALIYDDLCLQLPPNRDASEMIHHFNEGAILGFSQPFAQTDSYDEILSTGSLNIIADFQIRAELMTYYSANYTVMSRIESRITEYPKRFYELVPYSPEARITDANDIWENIKSSNICSSVRAEQNFGEFMQVQYEEWQVRKNTFLDQLTNYLNRLTV